jgi:hypothetical protein
LLGCLRITWSLLYLFVILLHENFLTDLSEILELKILDENHLRVEHKLLVVVHLLTEVVARWGEIENEMEVLSNSLEKVQVQSVANIGVFPHDISHILQVRQLIYLLLWVFLFFSFFASNKSIL